MNLALWAISGWVITGALFVRLWFLTRGVSDFWFDAGLIVVGLAATFGCGSVIGPVALVAAVFCWPMLRRN